MNLDVLIFNAHPDDAEIGMGGTIAKFSQAGLKVGIIDFSRGELGTRGTPEIRQKEAFESAIILKVALRENLDIPDGDIQLNKENVIKAIMMLRRFRPKLLFAPYKNDRHPDHMSVGRIARKAMFLSGLPKFKTFYKDTAQEPHRPDHLYYFMQTYTFDPSFIVDISDTFETKMKAINAYGSQFYNPNSKEPETFISKPGFIKFLESRAQFYGFKIRKDYGEPFFSDEDIEFDIIQKLKK